MFQILLVSTVDMETYGAVFLLGKVSNVHKSITYPDSAKGSGSWDLDGLKVEKWIDHNKKLSSGSCYNYFLVICF